MNRALKQRMYLLSAEFINPTNWEFFVEGSAGTNYKVSFKSNGMYCNCPYVETRHQTCKHMFFIIGRICKLRLEHLNTDNHRINPFSRYPNLNETLNTVLYSRQNENSIIEPTTNNLDDESDCIICFESMNTGELHNCGTCKNHFHKDCIVRWVRCKPSCPLCRGRIKLPTTTLNQPVDAMSKLTMITETQDEKLQKVIDFLKTNYKPFFSKSENPRKPNTNETILKTKLKISENKSSNQIIQELENRTLIPYTGNNCNLSKTAIEKCRKYNCWLFC